MAINATRLPLPECKGRDRLVDVKLRWCLEARPDTLSQELRCVAKCSDNDVPCGEFYVEHPDFPADTKEALNVVKHLISQVKKELKRRGFHDKYIDYNLPPALERMINES